VIGWDEWFPSGVPVRERRLVCALGSAFQYDDSGKTRRITGWREALEGYRLMTDNLLTFDYLVGFIEKPTDALAGFYACSGITTRSSAEFHPPDGRDGFLKKSDRYSYFCYSSLTPYGGLLYGFDPEGEPHRFQLSWFKADDDSEIERLLFKMHRAYAEGDAEYLFPLSPSPLENSIELLVLDSECDFIYVFAGSTYQAAILEAIAGQEPGAVIFARPQGGSVVDWVESGANPESLVLVAPPV